MRIKYLVTALIIFVSTVGVMLAQVETAHAAVSGASGTGYFSGKKTTWKNSLQYWDGDVLSGRPDDNAIPKSAYSKSGFIDLIEGRLQGSTRNKTGAAFIINTMVQAGTKGNFSKDRTPSAAMIAEWKRRINQPELTIEKTNGDPNNYGNGKISFYGKDRNDDFFTDFQSDKRGLLLFKLGGKVVYVIEIPCANPVGGLPGIEEPKKWTLPVTTTVSKPIAAPGDVVTWTHTIGNDGPDRTASSVDWRIKATPGYTIVGASPTGIPYVNSGSFGANKDPGNIVTRTRQYQIKASDVGKNLCQRISTNPYAWNDYSTKESSEACVRVASQYELTPEVSLDVEGIVDPGALTDVTASVKNPDGSPSGPVQWELSNIIVAPGGTIEAAADNSSKPGDYYKNTWKSLGTGTGIFTLSSTEVQKLTGVDVGELAVGTKICWALSISPPSSAQVGVWRHSEPKCLTIGKKPKLQVLGSDVRVRGEIHTSTSNVNRGGPKVFGSWVEFGAFSVADNRGLASGAGLHFGSGNDNQSDWSNLTFANDTPDPAADDSYPFGNYGELPGIPDTVGYFSGRTGTGFAGGTVPGASGVYTHNGSVTITKSDIAKGQQVIILASGTVTIADDIVYTTGSLTTLSEIPQLVIIANKIEIAGNVKQIDAWLIAKATINTCSQIPTPVNTTDPDPAIGRLSANVCNQPLVVNGPVATKKLYLYRTAGSGTGAAISDPAEKFNLRPDAYLWAYQQGFNFSQPTTASVQEQPPRF